MLARDLEDADLEISLGDGHYPVICVMDDDRDMCLPDPKRQGATLLIHGSPSRALEARDRKRAEWEREQGEAINWALGVWGERSYKLVDAVYDAAREVLEGWGIAVDSGDDTKVGSLVDEGLGDDLRGWVISRVKQLRDELEHEGAA